MQTIDFKSIHDRALPYLDRLLFDWFPEGEIRGDEFVVGNWGGTKGDSLSINLKKGFGKDFASGETAGDIIAIAAKHFNVKMSEAAAIVEERLGGRLDLTPPARTPTTTNTTADNKQARVDKIISESLSLTGTPAEKYLAGRGIKTTPEEIFRFRPAAHGGGSLVCIAKDNTGRALAVQQVYLTAAGEKDKSKTPIKRTNGFPSGNPIIIEAAFYATGDIILVCEGPEDGLTLHAATGHETWVTCGIIHMSKIPLVEGKNYIIVRDNDAPGSAADEKMCKTLLSLIDRGFKLHCARAPEGIKDANELLQKQGLDAVKKMIDEAQEVYDHRAADMQKVETEEYESESLDYMPEELTDREKRIMKCAQCTYTDVGNAERIVARWGHCAKTADGVGWIFYNKGVWSAEQGSQRAIRMATKTAKEIPREKQYIDPKNAESLKRWAKKSLDASKISGMVRIAGAHLTVSTNALDNYPLLFNCKNGVVDLKTGELNPHSAEYMMTMQSPIEYDPKADCPMWKQFIKSIFIDDDELIQYVQRAVGYSLTGDIREQCFFILHGRGSNGKSTFLDIIAAIMGDYHKTTEADNLTEKGSQSSASPYLVVLRGRRFVKATETHADKTLNETLIKRVTGETELSVRALYQAPITIKPQFKLWLATNHRPEIYSQDDGLWRRIKLIPFKAKFYDRHDPDAPTNGPFKDKDLLNKLRTELPGILTWAVEGCKIWLKEELSVPDAVQNATNEYREDMDIIGNFIEECCVMSRNESVTCNQLYEAYKEWTKQAGHLPCSKNKFGRKISERGQFERIRKTHGENAYKGLNIKDAFGRFVSNI
jgi:P4 family phage/plasmid primase-like protien